MKKLISLFLLFSMCFSLPFVMNSCDEAHTHTYKTEWAKDATHHWHECEGEACPSVSDKAEHSWNEGVISTEPTAEATGEKTFTCSVCNATKGEAVEFTGISEEKWNAMLAFTNFENYTLTETQSGVFAGTEMDQRSVFKVAGDKASVYMTVDGEFVSYLVYTGEEAVQQKKSYEQIYRALLANFDDFTYDKADGFYKSSDTITTEIAIELYQMSAVITMDNAKVKLSDDGKLLQFEGDCTQTTNTPEGTVVATFNYHWDFSDYGATVISETPEQ